ncbi:MAG: N(4)-(beta-N-acetylglucosaminyl)-L-asparaginase [Saprospiraceae bacterium]|nr:N(4)-(beta-N-acetylglucosaminyl)-L-asparaginase [Saprospiraceae bacterium]
MSDRRAFLKWTTIALPIAAALKLSSCKNGLPNKPLVVSTWDSGLEVNKVAWEILANEGKAIDAVEASARSIEDTVNCCIGLGGNPDREGKVTLDACIMDHQHNCGAVVFLEKIKHPISVARKIMDTTPHVMFAGEGALQFALESGFEQETGVLSENAEKSYKEWLKDSEYKPVINIEKTQSESFYKNSDKAAPARLKDGSFNHDTMGTIAMDMNGDLSGSCTTSGMGFKMRGRVGDSPIIGAGLFVDNEIGAATSSGQGEEVIRMCGTHTVVELMRQGYSPYEACKRAIQRLVKINPEKAKSFQVGFIAINKKGEYGAYAVQPGFNYSVTESTDIEGKVIDAESYFN